MYISITPRNTGPARAHRVDTPLSLCPSLCPLLYPPSSLYPDQMVAQAGTLSSPHRLAILNSQSYPYTHPHDARRGPHQRESHLGSAKGAGSPSLLAHVSGPHHAPIIPYHVVLSSPAFSDHQRHLKITVYIPLPPDERRIGYIDYKASSLVQSGLPSRPSFILPPPFPLDP